MPDRLRVKFWGGSHPDELLPLDIVESLDEDPIDGVSQGVINTLVPRGVRWRGPEFNIVHCYPGSPASSIPEECRACEVLQQSLGYDVVIDAHTARYGGLDEGSLDITRPVSRRVLGLLAQVGAASVMDISGMPRLTNFAPNSMGAEISEAGPNHSVAFWRATLEQLVAGEIPPADPDHFAWFRFAGSVTREQFERLQLPDTVAIHKPLERPDLAAEMGYAGQELFPVAWDRNANPYYVGEVVIRIATPNLQLTD